MSETHEKEKIVFFSIRNFLNTFPRVDFLEIPTTNIFSTLEEIQKRTKKLTSGVFRNLSSELWGLVPKMAKNLTIFAKFFE